MQNLSQCTDLFLNVHDAKRNMKLESLQCTGDTAMKYVLSVWLAIVEAPSTDSRA